MDQQRLAEQLSGLFVVSTVTIGVLAALLVWQLEHFNALPLTLLIVAAGVTVCALVFRRTESALVRLTRHFDTLLRTADEQSQRAEAANRLKDEFLATLSHELRTPLNAILGWAQIILARPQPDAETRAGLEAIERNARAQAQLIDDLLDMNQIIAGKLRLDIQRIDPAPVIHAAMDTVRPSAEAKRIRLRARIDPETGPVFGDPSRLQQIVWNLLSNAIKFTPAGGTVDVDVERSEGFLTIAVQDTGTGIPAAFLPYVFERFRQADSSTARRYSGLGLGLSIARQLVELHGGSIHAASAGEGTGATFIVRLPAPS